MDNNNPDLLIQHIQACLEESLEDSFEQWSIPSVIVSIHSLCAMQDLEPNLNLNRINSIGKLFGGFKGRHKLVLENILRLLHSSHPTSQIGLYFNRRDVPNMQWIFSSPFNVPRLVYHKAHENQLLVHPPFGERRCFKLDFEHIGQDMNIVINDDGFEVQNFNPNSPLKYPMDCALYGLAAPPQNLTCNSDGFNLRVADGRILNQTTMQFVDVFLGNVRHEKPNIRKAAFALAPNNEVQVIVLFTEFFMAAGTIRRKTGEEDQRLICALTEIPGSYGTSDFLCAESLKSMVRVSYFRRLKPEPAIEWHEMQKRLKKCRDQINELVDEVEGKLRIDGRKKKIEHNQDRKVLQHICLGLRSMTLLYETLRDGRGIRSIVSPSGRDLESFTVREKVQYAFFLLRKHCVGLPSVCNRDGECVMVPRFLEVCKEAVRNERIPGEYRLEFGYLSIFALFGLSEYLNGDHMRKIENQENFIQISFNIPALYQIHVENALCGLKLVGFPKVLRPILLEMVATSVTASEYKDIINIYKIRAQGEEVEVNQDLLKTLKKYPHILLFGTDGVSVPKELFKNMGDFLDSFFLNAENVILLDDDED